MIPLSFSSGALSIWSNATSAPSPYPVSYTHLKIDKEEQQHTDRENRRRKLEESEDGQLKVVPIEIDDSSQQEAATMDPSSDMSVSVSYTHLDVYKRQPVYCIQLYHKTISLSIIIVIFHKIHFTSVIPVITICHRIVKSKRRRRVSSPPAFYNVLFIHPRDKVSLWMSELIVIRPVPLSFIHVPEASCPLSFSLLSLYLAIL